MLNNIGALGKIPLVSQQVEGMPYAGISSDGGAAFAIGQQSHINNGNAFWVLGGNNLSVELWHWPVAAGSYQAEAMSGSTRIVGTRFQGTGHYLGYIAGQTSITSTHTFSVSKWHHLVITYDHATLRLYVDGAAEGTSAFVVTAADTYGLYLLADEGGTNWGTGAVCEVALYPSVLSSTRVLAHFNARENVSDTLVYKGAGLFSSTPGTTEPLSDLLAYVAKTYQNSP